MKKDFMFTSELVTEGHPDKLCDQISDAVVDHFLEQDPYARVRAECAVATSILFIASRFGSKATVDFANVARKVIKQIGYEHPDFNSKTCSILTSLKELPPDPYYCFDEANLTEDEIDSIPVRNQETVFGFACDQTPTLMPMPVWLAPANLDVTTAAAEGFYRKLAAYGHVGRTDMELPWERTDKIEFLR